MNSHDESKKTLIKDGLRDGFPICLGYFAVAFSLGIAARNAGMNAFQGFLISLLNNASAGEYAGITVIAAVGSYTEIALITLIANARYMLMSAALSQRISADTPFFHRLFIAYGITDELFGIGIARPGKISPTYMYAAFFIALVGWDFGTMFGVMAGNALPASVVSALSVALFGMFIAIIIPPAKKDRVVLIGVIISFIASYVATNLPLVSQISSGTRTIILTIAIAGALAFFAPIKTEESQEEEIAID